MTSLKAETPPSPVTPATRFPAIDALRGFVMILMALDHTRDFFTLTGFRPTDVSALPPVLMITRLVTHLCAPTFLFLAGLGAQLSLSPRFSLIDLKSFLRRRGLWIAFLGLTVSNFGWSFTVGVPFLEILWVLGVSMLLLSFVVNRSVIVIASFGFLLIFGHNLFDGITAIELGSFAGLWRIIHEPGVLWPQLSDRARVVYPLIPWVGVMALGFAFGTLWRRAKNRASLTARLGAGAFALFLLLRGLNGYGDHTPWQAQQTQLRSVLSFFNCEKYPPSLDYVLMTLGISLLLLAMLERFSQLQSKPLLVFGRVPLFFYLIHIYLLHGLAIVALPSGTGFSLATAYAIWIGVTSALYPLCLWYSKKKAASSNPLLRYL